MSFEMDMKSFQQRCWGELYSKLFVDLFNNFEYVGKEISISFIYEEYNNTGSLNSDYNLAILNKESFCRPLRVTTRIRKNETGDKIESDKLGPIMIPELTPRGFIIDGNTYDVVNLFREAFGWYITTDKNGKIIISLKTNYGGKYVISEKNGQLFIQHGDGKKSIGLAVFLKAVTELDYAELIDMIGMSNSVVSNTFESQLFNNSGELTVIDCIKQSLQIVSSTRFGNRDLSQVPEKTIRNQFTRAIRKIDIGNEGFERYKKFVTFQRRAEGAVLVEPVKLLSGEVIQDGTNLGRTDLIKIDEDSSVTSLIVEYEDNTYNIRKFPIETADFNADMLLNISSIAFAAFTGLGVLDNRDSLENRVIENVASYIVGCVQDYLCEQVCKKLDSANNRGIKNVQVYANFLSKYENKDYIVQKYKRESNVQLKDNVNIISELAKSYKLSYKKNNPSARIGDAVRNIKVRQYMRVCPIDTPESKEVGLSTYLTITAGVDDNGFITAKYKDLTTGKYIDLNALDEMGQAIMLWNEDENSAGTVRAHIDGEFLNVDRKIVRYKDVGPSGLLSLSTSYVPFIGNNKPKRALMATNMNRQAVHVMGSERPIVTTTTDNMIDVGIFRARDIVRDWAEEKLVDLTPDEVENTTITLRDILKSNKVASGMRILRFVANGSSKLTGNFDVNIPYYMASQSGYYSYYTINDQKMNFKGNDIVYTHRDIMMDGIDSDIEAKYGDMVDVSKDRINECGFGLGRDLKVIFKCYKGLTYEDAVVINRDLFENKSLTSVYITEIKTELQINNNLETYEKFGVDGIQLSSEEEAYIDSNGLPKIGSYIKGGQVVICKTRYETSELGNNNRENASVTLDSKYDGWVIDARTINGEVNGRNEMAIVTIASLNDISIGDKTVGRHGNKGVIARIVPRENMPFMENGDIPDIILSPLSPIARGNVGQLCECLVGMAGYKMGKRIVVPTLSSEDNYAMTQRLEAVLRDEYGFGEQTVYDGETGLPYDKKMFCGIMHMYKLMHTAKRPSKVIGAANNFVSESSQQPRNGQKISELQVSSYIAHGATEALDSLFSVQSDDIRGAVDLQRNIRAYGNSTDGSVDIHGDNKSNEIVRAYLRTLGIDLMTKDGGVGFKYLTDEDILAITDYSNDKVVREYGVREPIQLLHDEYIFGSESKKLSRTMRTRTLRRNSYGRIEFGYPVIMPIIFRNANFLQRFKFFRWSFEAGHNTIRDGIEVEDFDFLRVKVVMDTISTSVVSSLITDEHTTMAFCSKSLSYIDTRDLDNLKSDVLQKQAVEILRAVGFNTEEIKDTHHKNKFYSPQRINVVADMFYNYNEESFAKSLKNIKKSYEEYVDGLFVTGGYDGETGNNRFRFVEATRDVFAQNENRRVIDGSQYFVTKMLIMPSSFRPRFSTPHGERYNDIDATYIKIMNRTKELKSHIARNSAVDYEVSRLYYALDSCYKKPDGSKSMISISDMLLSSNTDKRSTVIRGMVGAKRISYSSRAVITVNPELHLTECGIPYKQALVMYEDNLVHALNGVQIVQGCTTLDDVRIQKLIRLLVDGNYYAIGSDIFDIHNNPIDVAHQVENRVIDELSQILKNEVVVLNREPSLHKGNSLAFIPILCEGYSIQLHPLVCASYNADFDGDSMGSYALKVETAKIEAREKMMTTNNIVNPEDGDNMLSLKQDIVLGIYVMTMLKNNSVDEIPLDKRDPVAFYENPESIVQDIDMGFISLYDYVSIHIAGKSKSRRFSSDRYYVSTAGRILFNSLLPEQKGFTQTPLSSNSNVYRLLYDKKINSKEVNKIVIDLYNSTTNNEIIIKLLDDIKEYGIKYADKCGVTLSIYDFKDKSYLVQDEINKVKEVVDKYDLYENLRLLPSNDKSQAVVKLWEKELKGMQKVIENSMDIDSSIYLIVDSGARGKPSDYNAICGIIGQVRNVEEEILERPILGNYLKGLSSDEYFISTYTARRGQISTSTKTSDSGTNNRHISQLLANVKVVEEDCGESAYALLINWDKIKLDCVDSIVGKTITGCKFDQFVGKTIVKASDSDNDNEITIAKLEKTNLIELELDGNPTPLRRDMNAIHRSLLEGRVVEEDGNDWLPNNLLKPVEYASMDMRDCELTLTNEALDWIEQNPHEVINVRLLIGCCAHDGVCSKCYGKDIETKRLIAKGKYIGLISATAISKVATQGTMDVHHATASSAGLGNVAMRFSNALNAKERVHVSKTFNNNTGDYEYSISFLRGNKFEKVAEGKDEIGAIKEQGLALCDGIVKVSEQSTMDNKVIVTVTNNDETFDYHIDKRMLIVDDGEEVRKYQPMIAQYDYNCLMRLDEDFTREFYIMDFANIFYSTGNQIRAIHFELIGREQTNYNEVKYDVDGCVIKEAFPRYMKEDDITEELEDRYPDSDVRLLQVSSAVMGKNAIMDSRNIIANAFAEETFSKIGKYCMNGKVDKCTSPLSNIFLGRKTSGLDMKKFTINKSIKPKKSDNDNEVETLVYDASDSEFVDDSSYLFDKTLDDGYVDEDSGLSSDELSSLGIDIPGTEPEEEFSVDGYDSIDSLETPTEENVEIYEDVISTDIGDINRDENEHEVKFDDIDISDLESLKVTD